MLGLPLLLRQFHLIVSFSVSLVYIGVKFKKFLAITSSEDEP